MIVSGMTANQIANEIMSDVDNVFKAYKNKDGKIRRIIIKSNQFPICLHSFIKTPKKNKWFLLWEARSKKDIGGSTIKTYGCWVDTDHGRYIFIPSWFGQVHIIMMYPPHLFSRYKERMNLNLEGNELMLRFFRYNNDFSFRYENEIIDDRSILHVYGTCKEGVCLGTKVCDCNMFIMKTFITYGMCKGEQIEDFAKSENIRQEMHDRLIK